MKKMLNDAMNTELIKTNSVNRSANEIILECGVSKEFAQQISSTPIVLLPDIQRDDVIAFAVGIQDFYDYCKSQLADIDICAEENVVEIELCSRKIRIGKILVRDVVLPLTLSLLASYIYDACKSDIDIQPTVIEQEYQAPPQVSFTIAVEDSCGVVRKEYSYDGPAKDIQEVTQHVEKLWNEEATK